MSGEHTMFELALLLLFVSVGVCGFDLGATHARRKERRSLESRLANDAAEVALGRRARIRNRKVEWI